MKIESLISARWVITVDAANKVLDNHSVAIQNGSIIEILPRADALQKYQADQHFDLPGHAVLPGLINSHTHAAMAMMKGLADDLPLMDWLQNHIWPTEGRWVDDEFVYDGSRLAIAEMLRSGTTCFNDMYFFPEATARAVDEVGMRASLGCILIDFPSRYADHADHYLQKGQQLQQQYANHPRLSTLLAPHAPYTVSDDALGKIKALSQSSHTSIHMHVHETAVEVSQAESEQGERPLARLNRLGLLDQPFLAVHMTQLSDNEIALLAEKKVHVIHCPESNLKLASGFCPVKKLLDAGVNVALGTDGNASNNDLDMFGEMRTAALLAKGVAGEATAVPAQQALRMATINGALALGLAEQIGSLEVNKAADLIAVDFNELEATPVYDPVSHLVYCTSRNQVSHSWVNGQLLMENRKLCTFQEQELRHRASHWQQQIEASDES